MASILEPSEWKQRTKRGICTPRSSELESIDRALIAYDDHPSTKTLIGVKNAIEAWQKKKGSNWSNSVRNTNGAVDDLIAAVNGKLGGGSGQGRLAQAAVQTRLAPPPPISRYTTLTDDAVVTQFATHAKNCFKNHWDIAHPLTTGNKLLEGVSDALTTCGVPDINIDIRVLPPGYNGFFDFSNWAIQVSSAKFSSHAMVYTDPPTNSKPHSWFVNIAETAYHEARHCEQWWHMARYYGHGKKPADVAADLGIPLNVASEACARPMRHGDPLLKLTEGWYESVYGGSKRGVVLHALGLKREQNPSPKILPSERGGAEIHAQYSGKLPEESDAWAIQDLVRAKF